MKPRWGTQTQLAIENFPISGEPVPRGLIDALAMIKAEAATVNAGFGVLPAATANAIAQAANEIVAGEMPEQFPVDVFQTGSGTSTNMNLNEVIANRSSELSGAVIHPNDHVNASQSSNDTIPSAMRIAAVLAIEGRLVPALSRPAASLRMLADRHADTVKMARTHLMDAIPMTFGQELGAWARAIELGIERLRSTLPRLCELPIGGTAAGTGLNAPAGFGAAVTARISERTGLPFTEADDHFEAQATQDAIVEVSSMLKVVALSLNKIAGDIRLLASGPNGGLAELTLPKVQAGSSIMPGKTNPVIAEMVQQVAAQVVGNDAAITFATASCSSLQITTAMPMIARNLLSSITLLTNAARVFDERCIAGIQANTERMLEYAQTSPSLATALAPRIGYDAAAELVAEAARTGTTISELLAARGEELDLLPLARPDT